MVRFSGNDLPNTLYSAEQVRELDRIAIQDFKISSLSLMQHAGSSAFETLTAIWPHCRQPIVFCGLGNNAGDGYVLAKLAKQSGLSVQVVQLGPIPDQSYPDAARCYQAMLQTGVDFRGLDADCLDGCDVVVDALFGTGLSRELSGEHLQAVQMINQSSLPVLAVDVPSGIDASTGRVWGDAIRASVTISFIGLKQGLFTGTGAKHAGQILFDDLEVPADVYTQQTSSIETISYNEARALLPPRPVNAHKGDHGHVLVIGGDHGMQGAARLAAEAAARSGAGLVSVGTRAEHASSLAQGRPELMVHALENSHDLQPLISRATVVCVGPGLGQGEWAKAWMRAIEQTDLPLVVDADALNLLAEEPNNHPQRLITPHPGEAARLLGISTAEVQADRFQAAQALRERYGGTVVLKGNGSLVCGSSAVTAVCTDGNPGMASGGMGDVLSGILAGLMAQGIDQETAAVVGVCVHAAAGDLAAESGQRGLLAHDLMPHIQRCVNPPAA